MTLAHTHLAAAASPLGLKKSDQNLVWLDCEMTGLDPKENRLIEIAVVVTNADLSIRIEGPEIAIYQSQIQLAKMDKWNRNTHGNSGLTAKVQASKIRTAQAQEQVLNFLKHYVPAGKSPLCGNTIGQDRKFLDRYMPKLEAFFHYRNLDVSTLKELAKRWSPEVYKGFKKKQKHTAMADVHESIEELIYYRTHLLK
jgi:oligoribonuclease